MDKLPEYNLKTVPSSFGRRGPTCSFAVPETTRPGLFTGVVQLGFVALLLVSCGDDELADFSEGEKERRDTGRRTVKEDGGGDGSTITARDASDTPWNPGRRDGGGKSDGGWSVRSGPRVKILSPQEADDPQDDDVIMGDEVTVVCEVRESLDAEASPVNESSIAIELLDAEGVSLQSLPGLRTERSLEYSAEFPLTTVPAGEISFRCVASDRSEPPLEASGTVSTFLDQGPKIGIISPEKDKNYPLRRTLNVEFRVSPFNLSDSDEEAAVDSVQLKIAGTEIEPLEVADDPGHYRLDVDLNDAVLFADTPSGPTSVVITATNRRTPAAATRRLSYSFVVDASGPAINILSPGGNTIVGGEVVFRFKITDEGSGVKPQTVVVEINDVAYPYDPVEQWGISGDEYTFRFDTKNAPGSKVQLTINVDARDKVGNPSTGASMLLYLDNVPPLIDLDPPPVRESKKKGDFLVVTSYAFDPVGEEAVNDMQGGLLQPEPVQNMVLFRAMVWDRTNEAPGQTTRYVADTDQNTVYLYAQKDPNIPLLIDTDNDAICDDLEWQGLPDMKLSALEPTGKAWYGPPNDDFINNPPYQSLCSAREFHYSDEKEPKKLCQFESSDMFRVISHAIVGHPPVIYAVSPTKSLDCTGSQWEMTEILVEGQWACFAVRAFDNAGNRGISPPLRICYDDPYTVTTCPPFDEAITCSDGCSPPVSFRDDGRLNCPIYRP